MTGFTLPDTLPVLADVEALPGVCALLTLADGSQLTVGPSDRPTLTPPSLADAGLLTGWDKGPEGSVMYRVPAVLSGRVAWALGCRPQTAPRLLEVQPGPDAVTFTAEQHWGCVCILTVPRGALMTLAAPHSGQPSRLTVTDQPADGVDARVFFFEVHPETPEGAACLAALGLTDRVGLPDGEE